MKDFGKVYTQAVLDLPIDFVAARCDHFLPAQASAGKSLSERSDSDLRNAGENDELLRTE